jgi:hypothetical protein
MKLHGIIPLPLLIAVLLSAFPAFSGKATLQEDLNAYYVKLDESFARIVDAGALRSTNLRPAERLFVRSMRKNIAYNTFLRTNSKGIIISEAIRGQKVERPMRDVSDQKWFRRVNERKEAYYTLIKDDERGRYYLFWTRPILKGGDRFVGAVVAKIDLWDSFYEFSNNLYEPFLIRLGRKSLFSHKWEEGGEGIEKPLTIQGIDRISVIYSSEKRPEVAAVNKDTVQQAAAAVDTSMAKKADKPAKKKKGASGILVFLLIVIILGIAGASFMLIAWMRRRAFLKHLDEEDEV